VRQLRSYFRSRESTAHRKPGRLGAECRETVGLAALWRVWRYSALEVEIAFEQWRDAPAGAGQCQYAIYADALRREGEAADRLAERYGRAAPSAI